MMDSGQTLRRNHCETHGPYSVDVSECPRCRLIAAEKRSAERARIQREESKNRAQASARIKRESERLRRLQKYREQCVERLLRIEREIAALRLH